MTVAVVGRLGAAQLSGVGVASAVLTMLNASLSFVGVLMAPYVARKKAQNKTDEVSQYLARNLWFCWFFGGILLVSIVFNVEGIVSFLRPAIEVRSYAIAYLKTVAATIPGVLTFLCCASTLRGLGDSTSVLTANGLNAVVNIVLDLIFVFGCGMGVVGAGLATMFALYLTNFMVLTKLIVQGSLKIADLCRVPNPLTFIPILRRGTQLSLRSLMFTVLLATTSSLIAQKGAVSHAAYELSKQTTLLIYVAYFSLEQTVHSFGASYLGRRDLKSGREIIIRVMQITFGLISAMAIGIFVFARPYAEIFTTNKAVISEFVRAAATSLLQPLSAIVTIIDGALIGGFKTNITAFSQASSYSAGIFCIVLLHWIGRLDVFNAFLTIRIATTLSVVITGPYLFSAKTSPYGFKLIK